MKIQMKLFQYYSFMQMIGNGCQYNKNKRTAAEAAVGKHVTINATPAHITVYISYQWPIQYKLHS